MNWYRGLLSLLMLVSISAELPAQFAEDFEGGLPPDWQATGLWHVTSSCSVTNDCNPVSWAYFGLDAACDFDSGTRVSGSLTTPLFSVPADNPELRYCSAYDGEGGSPYDWATVVVDDGSWVDGPLLSSPDWVTRTVDLSSFGGRTIHSVWSFDSVDDIDNSSLGWQIDDVTLTSVATGMPFYSESFESGVLPLGWSVSGLWHATSACPPPGATCDGGTFWAYYGQDGSCDFDTGVANSGEMITEPITIPAGGATLTYCSAYDGDGGPSDLARIKVLTVADGPLPTPSGNPVWQTRTVDLGAFGTHDIQLIFRFDSIDEVENSTLGWQVDDLVVFSALPPCASEQTIYTNRVVFDGYNPGLPLEDFEESQVAPGTVLACGAPIDENSTDCFQPGDIFPGVSFWNGPIPDPVGGLGVLGEGVDGNTSIQLVHALGSDHLRIEFHTDDVQAVGMDVVSHFNGQQVDATIFGLGGTELCSTAMPGTPGGVFWGISSDEVITAIELHPTASGNVVGCDNVAFGVGGPMPPINDECSDALPIFDGVTPYANLNATTDGPSACGDFASDIWYVYEASCSGLVTVETCGFATYDTELAVYEVGSCPPLTEIACNDDECDLQSRVKFHALAGEQFLLRVGGHSGSQGVGELTINCELVPFADECFAAFAITDGSTPFDTTQATDSGVVPCGDMASDIWYSYVATCTGIATLATCNDASFDTVLAVYEDAFECPPDVATLLACNDDAGGCFLTSTITFEVTEGAQYLVQLGGALGESGTGFLDVSCEEQPCETTLPFLTHSLSRDNVAVFPQPFCMTDDSSWRTFDLAAFGITEEISVTSIEIGVRANDPAGPTQDITVRLHSDVDDVPGPIAELVLLGEETFSIGVQTGLQLCLDLSNPILVPESVTNLVVEIANTGGDLFIPAINFMGETDDSYLSTDLCGISEPTSMDDLGFTGFHLVMYVFYSGQGSSFVRGDADGNGLFNGLVDGLYILDHQFQGGPPPPCFESGDADGNGVFNGLVDGLYVLDHQFNGGPAPPAPYPACGFDPEPATTLGCDEHPGCP